MKLKYFLKEGTINKPNDASKIEGIELINN